MSENISTTWFIANVLHPFLLLLMMHFTFGEAFTIEAIPYLLIGFIASLLLSLPCIFLNYACVKISFRLFTNVGERVAGWIVLQFISTYGYALVLLYLVAGVSEAIVYRFALPAALAMLLANLIGYKKIAGFAMTELTKKTSDITTGLTK